MVEKEELQIWGTRDLRCAASTSALRGPSPSRHPPLSQPSRTGLQGPAEAPRAALSLYFVAALLAKGRVSAAYCYHLILASWCGLRGILGTKIEGAGEELLGAEHLGRPDRRRTHVRLAPGGPPRECELGSGQEWKLTVKGEMDWQ